MADDILHTKVEETANSVHDFKPFITAPGLKALNPVSSFITRGLEFEKRTS